MIEGKSPKITVVIPTYNHAHFLVRALESVLSQKFTDLEVVIINNFSQDNTEEVVSSFNDSRLRLINFSNGGVIAASRNEGIRQARGEYIAFLDSDDYWYPEKLGRCYNRLLSESADLATHHLIKNTNGKLGSILTNGPEELFNYQSLLFLGNCITNSSVVVRKSALEDIGLLNESKEIITAEDYDLWLRLAKANFKFVLQDEALGEYFIHSVNNSSAIEKHLRAVCKVFENHISQYPNSSHFFNRLRISKRMGIIFYGAARQATSQFKFAQALNLFKKSISYYPFRLKTYLGIIALIATGLKGHHAK